MLSKNVFFSKADGLVAGSFRLEFTLTLKVSKFEMTSPLVVKVYLRIVQFALFGGVGIGIHIPRASWRGMSQRDDVSETRHVPGDTVCWINLDEW